MNDSFKLLLHYEVNFKDLEKFISTALGTEMTIINTSNVKEFTFKVQDDIIISTDQKRKIAAALQNNTIALQYVSLVMQQLYTKGLAHAASYTVVFDSDEYKENCESLQCKIDSLMNEYCPEEMSTTQIKNWGLSQIVSGE